MKPVIVVVGATGNQGGSCVDALLLQGACKVRGLTRNADSRQAQNLVSRNVDVAEGDLNNKNSLVKAFDGAHGVFLVTDFYRGAGGSVEKEIQQGRNAVDAAQQASVKHLVWSGLEDPRPVAHGALPETQPGRIIPHFESKAEITNMIQKSGLAHTILEPSIFYENAIQTFQFKKQEDGSVAFSLNAGAKAHPQCAVADIGTSAAVAFANFKSYSGAVVPVVGQHITFFKVADVISQMTAQRVQYVPVTRQQVASLPFPHAAEIANMFQYYVDFSAFADRRPIQKAIVKGLTFEDWAQRHRDVLTAKVLAAH